ncbi:MAG: hypothetical protein DMD35_20480 [Gemmatimonadetes bacterium]|nr:MAG: hypothetical protein DMD35_20480 [Gemmatimonadota bacterium]
MTASTNCPDDLTLLAFAMNATGDPRADAHIAAHVQQCASCRITVLRHRELAAAARRATREANDVRGECLDEMAIAALAEANATDDDRAAATAHLVTCASCRSQLTELRAALDDAAMTAALPRADATRRLRQTFAGGLSAAGLAAAAVLVFAIGQHQNQRRTREGTVTPMRDETGALVVAPLTVSPMDIVSGTPVFRWSRVPRANRYRVRVFSPDGVVVWDTQTSDTTAVPPSPITLQRATRYLWKVEARTDFDRWVGSALTEFQLSTDGVRP